MRGQDLQYTMFRYLTSKGLRKDSVGVSKLTILDVKNIEHGITNYKYVTTGFRKRMNDIFYDWILLTLSTALSFTLSYFERACDFRNTE